MSDKCKAARVRAVAAEVVDAVVCHGRSLDTTLTDFQGRVAENDRALLRMLCFGTVRNHWLLREWGNALLERPLKKRDRIIESLLAVGLFQLHDTRIPDHAAVSETVEAARLLRRPKHAGLLNAVLRRFGREKIGDRRMDDEQVRYNHPSWLIDDIRRDWPDDWDSILAANNERSPMWLRANTQRNSAEDYLESLQVSGIVATTAAGFDAAVRLETPLPVGELPGFDSGQVSVQDAGAQLAAPWLLATNPKRVLDACAAPGGKSAHLLESCLPLQLTALDIDADRLGPLRENLSRLGLVATVTAGDASKPDEWWDGKLFDAILLDAPCSSTGVIRRHPDIKHLKRATDIDALASLQMAILRALWPLLAPAGRLLYVTCSVLAAENDAVVDAFLASTTDAQEDDMLPNYNIRDVMRRKVRGYQILPGAAGLDGFYYACLEKVA